MLIADRDVFEGADVWHERIKQSIYDVRFDDGSNLTPDQVHAVMDSVWERLHDIGFFAGMD